MATMYALTKQEMSEDQAMDSYNLLPLLLDEPEAKGREIELYQGGLSKPVDNDTKKFNIRMGYWKLIIDSDPAGNIYEPEALFNLEDNPYEEESGNLINDPAQQERINEMYNHYVRLRSTNERTTPVFRPDNRL